jgi:hypothetical protein
MEGIAGEAAHTRRLSTGRPHGAGEAIRSGSLDDGLLQKVGDPATAGLPQFAVTAITLPVGGAGVGVFGGVFGGVVGGTTTG